MRTDAVHTPKHLPVTDRAGDWTSRAACAGMDVNVFYLDRGGPLHRALAICRGCPVTSECLEFGLAHSKGYGVFGGLTATQRRTLQRGQRVVTGDRGQHCRHCDARLWTDRGAPMPAGFRTHHGRGLCGTCGSRYYRKRKVTP